jgi:hypothetical protein
VTSPLHAASIVAPAEDVVARDIAGQHLIVPIRSGIAGIDCLFTADEVGSFLYARLDGRRDATALARLVCDAFEVDVERALPDVLQFLDALCESGLARRVEAA